MPAPSRRLCHRVGRRTSRGLVRHRESRDPTMKSQLERPMPGSPGPDAALAAAGVSESPPSLMP
jgi:hypothetical protein